MVIKGRSRGNGAQLANYLLNSKGNEKAILLEIRGTTQSKDLSRSLTEMSISSNLTKRGEKGLYHAQINPAIGEDSQMSETHWLKAVDVLEKELGLTGQNRVIVLHEKKGRTHSHIVWERYDHKTGKLRTDSQNFQVHDKARAEIEQVLGHERTPQKKDRKREIDHKKELTRLWEQYQDCRDFVKAAKQQGYEIAVRDDRRPYRAITPDGQDLDLVRQLQNTKSKEVKHRLEPIAKDLTTEAEILKGIKSESKQSKTTIGERGKSKQKEEKGISTQQLEPLAVTPVQHSEQIILINEVAQQHAADKELRRQKVLRELQIKQSREQEQEKDLER